MDHARRIGQLRRRLSRASLPGLLVTHLPDVRYLSGFTGSSAALAITRRAACLFTDGRYTAQAAQEVQAAKVQIVPSQPALAAVQWLAAQASVSYAGFDPTCTTVAELNRWRLGLPAKIRRGFLTELPAPMVEPLRLIKDEDEMVAIRRAAKLGCRIFDHILEFLRPGVAELDVAAEMEHQARLGGAQGMSFETIVVSAERSAMPHGKPTMAKLPRRGFVTMDFGVLIDGYCSDMTRTVFLGRPKVREREVYAAVLEAQQAAVASVQAGVSCHDVDFAARERLRRAELSEFFTHSTGHGVGLEIHENPRVGAKQSTPLQAGMVITIEPGVYLPSDFGIRIEDMVLVTRSGGEVLTPAPKALIEL